MSKITGGVFQALDKVMQSPGTPDAAQPLAANLAPGVTLG
jgi:hypothetical protein